VPGPLSGLRVAVTIPPSQWFGGIDYNFAVEMADEIRRLGANVFELEVYPFVARNEVGTSNAIEALKTFRPDVAVSLPNSLYVLHCVTLRRENVFRDILQIPTLMLWDHGLFHFPKVILDPLPYDPANSVDGCLARIREVMDHPLYLHYSPDHGHIAELGKLGVIDPQKVRFFLQPAYPNFVRYGYRNPSRGSFDSQVAFAGNVYLRAAKELPFRNWPVLNQIETRMLEAKKQDLTQCLWDLLMTEIAAVDGPVRKELSLYPDSTLFWSFAYEEIEFVGNTNVRLSVLNGLKRRCEFFGNFVEPESVATLRDQHRMTFRKCLDYFTELPVLFMNSEIIVDIVNLGYNSGISPKIMGCFACGGMVLFDYKEDFLNIMGEVGNLVMYRNVDHLNELVETYLGDPRKRKDVSRYLQHRICTEFSFGRLCKRILIDEPAWRT
jgi:hypothetical protein